MFEIKIGENEFRQLLEREKALAGVAHAFFPQIQTLRDIVNYGTNLIPRAHGSSDKELSSIIVIGTLLRQIVAMLGGATALHTYRAILVRYRPSELAAFGRKYSENWQRAFHGRPGGQLQ
jgi:hypothetical protein